MCAQVYLNYASRVHASTEMSQSQSQAQTSADHGVAQKVGLPEPELSSDGKEISQRGTPQNLGAQASLPERTAKRQRKMLAAAGLIETDLDWDAASSPQPLSHSRPSKDAATDASPSAHLAAEKMTKDSSATDALNLIIGMQEGDDKKLRQSQTKHPATAQASEQDQRGSSLIQHIEHEEGNGLQSPDMPETTAQLDGGSDMQLSGSHHLAAAAMEEYSPSRHGGESPPRGLPNTSVGLQVKLSSF